MTTPTEYTGAHYKRLEAIKKDLRRRGYRPAPKYGKGEWVNADCTVASIRFDPSLGWYWLPFVSWTLLHRDVKRAVAATGSVVNSYRRAPLRGS